MARAQVWKGREHKEFTPRRRRKLQPDPYSSKIIKKRSEQEQNDLLRVDVRRQDIDAFEEWDEPEY